MIRHVFTAVALTIGLAPISAAHDEIRISSLLVFGDSLSDTGNLSLATEGAGMRVLPCAYSSVVNQIR